MDYTETRDSDDRIIGVQAYTINTNCRKCIKSNTPECEKVEITEKSTTTVYDNCDSEPREIPYIITKCRNFSEKAEGFGTQFD